MKVLTEGYRYIADNFEEPKGLQSTNFDNPYFGQLIQFIQKEKVTDSDGSEKLVTVNNGTTNEEVIEILIDRLKYLSNKLPSRETSIAITKLEEALMWLEKRTKDRIKRNVEGTYQK